MPYLIGVHGSLAEVNAEIPQGWSWGVGGGGALSLQLLRVLPLYGAHVCLLQRVREKALEDVVVLNADSNTLETPFDDVQALPPDVVSAITPHPCSSRWSLQLCPTRGPPCVLRYPC